MPQSISAPTDLDLIIFLKAIPDTRMRRGIRIPSWYMLLVAALGILNKCESLRDLERFARRHHAVHTETLGIELNRPPSEFSLSLLLPAGGCGVLLRGHPRLDTSSSHHQRSWSDVVS